MRHFAWHHLALRFRKMDKARGPVLGCHFSRASVSGPIGVKSHVKACHWVPGGDRRIQRWVQPVPKFTSSFYMFSLIIWDSHENVGIIVDCERANTIKYGHFSCGIGRAQAPGDGQHQDALAAAAPKSEPLRRGRWEAFWVHPFKRGITGVFYGKRDNQPGFAHHGTYRYDGMEYDGKSYILWFIFISGLGVSEDGGYLVFWSLSWCHWSWEGGFYWIWLCPENRDNLATRRWAHG